MAEKISALPVAITPLNGGEEVPIVQTGTTKRATTGDIAALAGVFPIPILQDGNFVVNADQINFTGFMITATDDGSGGANVVVMPDGEIDLPSAAAGSGAQGGSGLIISGTGDGAGGGGDFDIVAGNGGATGRGGEASLSGGQGHGTFGGGVGITAGNSVGGGNAGAASVVGGQADTGTGGQVFVRSGGTTAGGPAGDVRILGANSGGAGKAGDVYLQAGGQFGAGRAGLIFLGVALGGAPLPTADPGVSGALWVDVAAGHVLKVSP